LRRAGSASATLSRSLGCTKPGSPPLSSLHAPTPRHNLPDGRVNTEANLASPGEEERRLAVAEHVRTIEIAGAARLPLVVLHLGGVGAVTTPPELRIRDLVAAGVTTGEEVETLRDELRRWRAGLAEAHVEAAKRSLRELVAQAAPYGIALGLETRLNHHEIPHPQESLYLLSDYDNSQAGHWHDTGHAEVQARLGLIDRGDWFPALTSRTIGSHLHDVDGIVDHRAPGNGDVDWGYIAAGLPPTALRVFEIDQGQPDDKVAAGIAYLRARGVIE
jgi:sugar phosphate isomerase/epimerase